MATVIKKCTCKSHQQDEMYGEGMRLYNESSKGGVQRCTVCSNVVKSGK